MRHHNIFASRDSHAKLICSVRRLGVNVQTWPQVHEISLSKKKRNKTIPQTFQKTVFVKKRP